MFCKTYACAKSLVKLISWQFKKWAVQFNPKKRKNIVFRRTDRVHPRVYFGLNGDEISATF